MSHTRPGYVRVFHEGYRVGRGPRGKKSARYWTWKKCSRADKVNWQARARAKARYVAEGKRLLKHAMRLLRQYQRGAALCAQRRAALSRSVDRLWERARTRTRMR